MQEPVRVRPRAKRPRHRDIITEPSRDEKRHLGDGVGLVDIDAHALTHAVGQLLHHDAVDEGGVIVNEPGAALGIGEPGDFFDRRTSQGRRTGGLRHRKPFLCSFALSRSRQRPRMKPIEPHARLSVLAISWYGRGGDSKKSI